MKCEGFTQITDLVDYLHNNLIIAHFCGFDITKDLPSYWSFDRFIRVFGHDFLKQIMQSQVLFLSQAGIVDTSFIGLDSTPIAANTSQNNPKSFASSKFKPANQPKADTDCKLGVHTASNQSNEKNYEFYWGYKNHVLVDCITGLPIFELTTTANVHDSSVALDILKNTNEFLPISECYFIADKGYDSKDIYNTVKETYLGECFIPLNVRGAKSKKLLPIGHPVCDAGLAMNKDGKAHDQNRTRQKFCCPLKASKASICPCNHKNFNNGKKNKGCVKWITIPDDYRLSIDRDSKHFRKIYALRTECERYNSRFKYTGQERSWVRNQKSVTNMNTVAHISLLAIAIAAYITQQKSLYRKSKTAKRVA